MVSVEDALAMEPAKKESQEMSTTVNKSLYDEIQSLEPVDQVIKSRLSSGSIMKSSEDASKLGANLEGVCHTAGFINSQNIKQTTRFPNNVRFVVQPVVEDGKHSLRKEDQSEQDQEHQTVQTFTFLGVSNSADDISGPYS